MPLTNRTRRSKRRMSLQILEDASSSNLSPFDFSRLLQESIPLGLQHKFLSHHAGRKQRKPLGGLPRFRLCDTIIFPTIVDATTVDAKNLSIPKHSILYQVPGKADS